MPVPLRPIPDGLRPDGPVHNPALQGAQPPAPQPQIEPFLVSPGAAPKFRAKTPNCREVFRERHFAQGTCRLFEGTSFSKRCPQASQTNSNVGMPRF